MEIIYRAGSYFGSSLKSEFSQAVKSAGGESGRDAAYVQAGDSVKISEQGRALQQMLAGKSSSQNEGEAEYGKDQSRLMNLLEGREPDSDKRLAYGGLDGAAAESGGESDTEARIRDLQTQLKAAMKRLQEARQELTEAQAKKIAEIKSMQGGDSVNAASALQQQVEQECSAAQQKIAAASAELNSVQEQLQKTLHEKNKEAQASASTGSSVGEVWSPQGTNDYIRAC